MEWVYDLTGKLTGFSCCFVALELPNFDAPRWLESALDIREFFNGTAQGLEVYGKIRESEEELFREFSETLIPDLFEPWLTSCIKNRRGYQYLNIVLIDFVFRRKRLSAELARKAFLKSYIFTTGEMTHTYAYLLNSLRQAIMLDVTLPQQHSAWRNVAVSLGPVPWYAYSPDEPMNLATLAVVQHGITVIMAVGNEGHLIRGNSLSPWSVAPWVIGVGATNRVGTKLLNSSSRGVPNADFSPTVVAPGEAESEFAGLDHGDIVALEHIKHASPGVANLSVGRNVFRYFKDKNGRIEVTLVQDGKPAATLTLDQLLDKLRAAGEFRRETIFGTSLAVEYVKAICSDIAIRVKALRPNWPKNDRPKIIKTVLEDMAQPLSDHGHWETGSGVVTLQIAREYLAELSDTKIATLCDKARLR